MAFTIDPGLCPQNHRCPLVAACPAGAISPEGFALPEIDPGRCVEYGLCAASCGRQAVRERN
ncbi:4Fe-4S ferredoxin [uncultured Alistipes sp.]|uniref:4Fe-4S ferredoxin n=1 Tax=uncultured Alistipes sp. TaxID=538949 RepID=UPI00265CCB49|nr:4Fe-4S ferredoxin [uncultured Alistipes sp.]